MSSSNNTLEIQEIVSITGDFDEENLIGEDGLGKAYKATLSQSGELVDVVVRRVDHSYWMQDIGCDKEIRALSSLKHKNLVSHVGYCKNNEETLVVNKLVARGKLKTYLNDPIELTWMRRLKISVDVASALKYMHNHNVIHHNVNSKTILLDENWEAKLSGFEHSLVIQEGHPLDPVYDMTTLGTYKSDAFCFGILLFEILCGTELNDQDDAFQPPLARSHYEENKLHEFVHQDLYKQMDRQSFKIFSETAYKCLKERRAPPKMNQVLGRLEIALELQEKYENNEHSSTVVPLLDRLKLEEYSNFVLKGPSSERLKLKLKQLEHMKIKLEDIESATKDFTENCIMTGGFSKVYRTELEHVDRKYCKAIGENVEVSMSRSEVAVKRIVRKDESGEQGFYAEIDMLTSCKHVNIVTLFGFCNEKSEMILVYEYASEGSLARYLTRQSNKTKDSWVQRMKISLQVANGLSYLHTSEGDRKEIVHRDIKSANILLDENLDAKIGDFGLCKYLYSENEEHNTLYSGGFAGTPEYIDPQYVKEGKLRKELDIYCLGVVMFEMLCGRVAYDPVFFSPNNRGLARTARRHFLKGTVEEFVDERMKEGNREPFISIKRLSSFKTFSQIAFRCLAEAQADRPTLECVIKELKESLPFQGFYDIVMELRSRKKISKKEPKSSRSSIPVSIGITGSLHKTLLKINETGRMLYLLLLVGFFGVIGTMWFLILNS